MTAPGFGRVVALVQQALRSPAFAVAALTIGAGSLRLFGLDGATPNPYYDATVLSMGQSWHNFFFVAFEPGASVASDKPPLALWLEVLSTKVFGLSTSSMILPQALASTAAVPLLYDMVRRVYSHGAGLAAGAALAVLPISVLTARSDTIDSMATSLSVVAAWLVVRAAQSGRARLLVAAGVVLGLAFETKLFEGLIAVPALTVVYWLASPVPIRRRAGHLGLAALALVTVALAWPVAVSMAPTGSHPWVLGSKDGSEANAIVEFNGLSRVVPPKRATHSVSLKGAPGPRRLFTLGHGSAYGYHTGIELIGALLLGGFALIARAWTRDGPPDLIRKRRALGVGVALWLLPAAAVFSFVTLLHPRYIEAIAPAIAAALGIGLAGLARVGSRGIATRLAGAALLCLATVYLAKAQPGWAATLSAVLAGCASVALLLGPGRMRRVDGRRALPIAAVTLVLAALAMLAPPAFKSYDIARNAAASDAGAIGSLSHHDARALSRYLQPRTRGLHWELAVYAYYRAPTLILRDRRPVLILAGVHLRPIFRDNRLQSELARGRLRYAYVGNACGTVPASRLQSCPRTIRWIRRHGVDVSHAAGLAAPGSLFRLESRSHGA
jgi:4-amino-4-deoxy-L-arabinose transferase-like glycosyltransferase